MGFEQHGQVSSENILKDQNQIFMLRYLHIVESFKMAHFKPLQYQKTIACFEIALFAR